MRRAVRLFAAVIIGVLLLMAGGTIIPRPITLGVESGAKQHRILVLSNPIHTDIAIPIDAEVRDAFGFLGRDGIPIKDAGARYLIFGWGGRSFYIETPIWADLKFMSVVKALTADAAAMHVDIAGDISEALPNVAGYDVDDAGFDRLLTHIRSSFKDIEGQPIVIPGADYGTYDRFYEAHGTFNALLGCNTWTAAGLREAGLRTGWWNPLPVVLGYSMRLNN